MTTRTHHRLAVALATAASIAAPAAVRAQDDTLMVRLRAVQLVSANQDTTELDLSVNDKLIPEIDLAYFFTPNLAAELVLTYPQEHELRAGGTKIGSLKHLPPTLTLQYRFGGMGSFQPYVGAGLNYTRFSSVQFDPAVEAALSPSIDKNSFGLALQAGFDVQLTRDVYLNFDIKKVQIRTDVSSAGTKVGEFRVDPLLVGIGIGQRF